MRLAHYMYNALTLHWHKSSSKESKARTWIHTKQNQQTNLAWLLCRVAWAWLLSRVPTWLFDGWWFGRFRWVRWLGCTVVTRGVPFVGGGGGSSTEVRFVLGLESSLESRCSIIPRCRTKHTRLWRRGRHWRRVRRRRSWSEVLCASIVTNLGVRRSLHP